MRFRTRTGVALMLMSLAACSVQARRENQGPVCALSAEGRDWQAVQVFEADAPVTLQYFVDECLSSSCDRDRSASCAAVLEGDVLRVETQAAWTVEQGGPCTADCGRLTATCTTPKLAEGEYTLRSGDHEVSFTVPSEVDLAPCTEDPSW